MVSKSLIYKFIIDIIYPNRCPICSAHIKWDKLICGKCEEKLPITDIKSRKEYVYDKCENNKKPEYDGAYSVMLYKDDCKRMIYALKHSGQVNNFAEYAADKLSEKLDKVGLSSKIDVVTAVPMNRRKKSGRGHNQAEIIAQFLACDLKKKTDFTLLRRTSDSTEQHHLSAVEREIHAKKVFAENPKHTDISGKTVLLCDDVMTTGSTFNACAEILKKMGADKVYCASIAVTSLNG